MMAWPPSFPHSSHSTFLSLSLFLFLSGCMCVCVGCVGVCSGAGRSRAVDKMVCAHWQLGKALDDVIPERGRQREEGEERGGGKGIQKEGVGSTPLCSWSLQGS